MFNISCFLPANSSLYSLLYFRNASSSSHQNYFLYIILSRTDVNKNFMIKSYTSFPIQKQYICVLDVTMNVSLLEGS